MRTIASLAVILVVFAASSAAVPEVPLLADGMVNLGPLPGEMGVWELTYIENMANTIVAGRGSAGIRGRNAWGSAAEPQVPFMPWSAARYNYNVRNEAKYDPESYCLPPGGPRLFTAPYPMQIVQLPDQKRIFIFFEVSHAWREIYMDGRPHPSDKNGTWLGHSVGRYEDGGKTLTIDVANFNEGTWLDFAGHPHTNMLHVVEKLTRPTKNQLHYEALIDDPGAYTRPWTVAWDIKWWPGGQLDEYVCEENNKYIRTLKDDFGKPIFLEK
jgi:hypothetical protein